jgi:hypothetical protein
MNLKNILRKLVPMRWQRPGKDDPIAMVLLLQMPHFFRAEELQHAAEKAWGTSFAGGKGSTHFVVQSGEVTFMKAGPHLLTFFTYPQPYIENPKENIEWLRQASQRQAWVEHAACVGVDYMNKDVDVELAYCVLSKLVAEMADENCTGVYIPRENILIPNGESFYRELQKMASSREPGVKQVPELQ